ncbi:MAG: hypothetical protein WAW03_04045 [Anaerolineae bacterium]
MILDFTFAANRQTIRITAPQVDLALQVRNLVGYHLASKQIISIGDTSAEMKANAPAFWEKNHAKITFLHPFDFTEKHPDTGAYEPLIAARLVQWYADHAFRRIDRRSFKRMLLSPWVDRVDYHLELADFDALPPATRQQFVRHLKKLLVAARHVQINGATVIGKPPAAKSNQMK